jgi:AraC-like DNA-binding protein
MTLGLSIKDIKTVMSNDGQPAHYLTALMESHGINISEVSDDFVVPMSTTWNIFTEHAAQIDDEFHGATDIRLRSGASDLIVARMLLSDTMIEAFRAYATAWKVLVPNVKVSVIKRETGTSLKWAAEDPDNEVHQIFSEGIAIVFYGIFNWMTGMSLKVVKVNAAGARQTSASNSLRLLGAPISFSGNDLEIIFAPEVADLPVLDVKLEAWRDCVNTIVSNLYLETTDDRLGGMFAEKVRSAISLGLDQNNIAHQWGISVKTLARRLRQEGCTFLDIQNDVRMQRAKGLIQSGAAIDEIGYILGYRDPRSFRRAFRRWVGVSPSTYRARYKAPNPST